MRVRVRLETIKDCVEFANALEGINPSYRIELTDGKRYTISAHSFIGICCTLDWNGEIYADWGNLPEDWDNLLVVSDHDIYMRIRKFIIEESAHNEAHE